MNIDTNGIKVEPYDIADVMSCFVTRPRIPSPPSTTIQAAETDVVSIVNLTGSVGKDTDDDDGHLKKLQSYYMCVMEELELKDLHGYGAGQQVNPTVL